MGEGLTHKVQVKQCDLPVIKREEFLFDISELTTTPNTSNFQGFRRDFIEGILSRYGDTYVAYTGGAFLGQSRDPKRLYDSASSYLGDSNFAVFKVPPLSKHAFNDYVEAEVKKTALGKID